LFARPCKLLWASYLAQPEIGLSVHTVDNYISIFNTLLIRKIVPPAGVAISKLEVILPHLTEQNAPELIEKAKTRLHSLAGKQLSFWKDTNCINNDEIRLYINL